MFGATVRVAVGWAGGQLFLSVPAALIKPHILPTISDALGQSSLLYSSLSGTLTWMPLFITVAALLKLIAAGQAEGGAPVR